MCFEGLDTGSAAEIGYRLFKNNVFAQNSARATRKEDLHLENTGSREAGREGINLFTILNFR